MAGHLSFCGDYDSSEGSVPCEQRSCCCVVVVAVAVDMVDRYEAEVDRVCHLPYFVTSLVNYASPAFYAGVV